MKDLKILGVVVGTFEDWDYHEAPAHLASGIQYMNVKLNEMGVKWSGQVGPGVYELLSVNWTTGELTGSGPLIPEGTWTPCWHDLIEVM